MRLAEDISNAAIAFRTQSGDFRSLQGVVKRWSDQLFWAQDADGQISRVSVTLAQSAAFQLELATAIRWEMPQNDSPELTLLAIDAARGKISQFNSGVFGK